MKPEKVKVKVYVHFVVYDYYELEVNKGDNLVVRAIATFVKGSKEKVNRIYKVDISDRKYSHTEIYDENDVLIYDSREDE